MFELFAVLFMMKTQKGRRVEEILFDFNAEGRDKNQMPEQVRKHRYR